MSAVGRWDSPSNALQIVGVHAVVLYTGKVLFFSFDPRANNQATNTDVFSQYFPNPNLGSYQIWDPKSTSAAASPLEIGRNVFCSGQCALPDGTIFVVGGQDQYGAVEINGWIDQLAKWLGDAVIGGSDEGALKDVHTYDPGTDVWTNWPQLQDGRYYPTCLGLDTGAAFVAGGLSNLQRWVFSGGNWCENDKFQVFRAGALDAPNDPQDFTSADQYPMIKLLPGTRHLWVHIETVSRIWDLDSNTFIAGEIRPPDVGRQTYPMQTGHVLLPQKQGDPPRILAVGGSTASGFDYDTHSDAPGVQDAFIFEYNSADPGQSRWRKTLNQMHDPRLLTDAVLLPDGTVFIVNGIMVGAAAGHSGATVGRAEIFDPVTETFTLAASPSPQHPRGYHATAVLLPDARVAIAGNTQTYNPGEPASQDDTTIEIYYPPYLMAGPRPSLSAPIPASINYGSTIAIDNTAAPAINGAMMMRPCAVTHSVDMDQRAIKLVIQQSGNQLNLTFPTDRSLAPPGPYMLFVLADGVPSEATFFFLGVPAPSNFGQPSGGAADCSAGGPYPPVTLGPFTGAKTEHHTVDGDVTVQKVENNFNLTLESKHGGITIQEKIDQHSWVKLTACGTINIGQKIDQHSQADIVSIQGDVMIGQKIDQHSSPVTIKAVSGSVVIQQKIDQWSSANIQAGTSVWIGQKIDQHCSGVSIQASADVIIVEGIDQHCDVTITSDSGNIVIGKIDQHCTADLIAPNGSITITDKIDNSSHVRYRTPHFHCSTISGGSTAIPF